MDFEMFLLQLLPGVIKIFWRVKQLYFIFFCI